MNKILVIYKSKTGFTKKYAEWIAQERACDLVPYEKRKSIDLNAYETIVFGGGFHAGIISGLKWFKENLEALSGKNVIVFATGASPAATQETQMALRQNFTEQEWQRVKAFYLQSGLCYEKMGRADKLMMAVFRKMLEKTEGDSEMKKMIRQSYDVSRKEQLLPLLECCKRMEGE